MNRSIVWFTTDLRLEDNETLVKAIHQSDEIIPIYCFDDAHFKNTDFGLRKTGKFRTKFLIESLVDLDGHLREKGSGLTIVKGVPEKEIIEIVEKYEIQKIFTKKQIGIEEKNTQKKVANALEKLNCTLEFIDTRNLHNTEDLPFEIHQIPDVFTNFRIQVEKKTQIREIFPQPTYIPSPTIDEIKLPSLDELGLSNFIYDSRAAITFKGGETAGKKRLNEYLFETHAIASYKHTRNGLIGQNYSSKFSSWLALGCLSARTIYQEIKKYETLHCANESTYWLIFELMWRDFFAFMMEKYPFHYFRINGISKNETMHNSHIENLFQIWCNGETDNDFVNANMIELNLTGFMSNRGRQNVASYFCHELKLDWRYGAAYFEQQLIDYDVSSNWCNWAYIAGVGNNPRGVSVFNIEKQANEYDKNKTYRNLWLTKK
jgi:deoxyribodipyrimidine photo-lyase